MATFITISKFELQHQPDIEHHVSVFSVKVNELESLNVYIPLNGGLMDLIFFLKHSGIPFGFYTDESELKNAISAELMEIK